MRWIIPIALLCLGGASYDFDGAGDVIYDAASQGSGHAMDIVGGPMTLMAWVNIDTDDGTIISKRDAGNNQWQMYVEDSSCTTGTQRQITYQWLGDDSVVERWDSCTTADGQFTNSEWHHIAVAIDGADGKPQDFYIDGTRYAPDQQTESAGNPQHFDNDVSIGARWNTAPTTAFEINGRIAYPQIHDVYLDAQEINEAMYKPWSVTRGLKGAADLLDESSPLPDQSAEGNTWTVTNATAFADGPPVQLSGGAA